MNTSLLLSFPIMPISLSTDVPEVPSSIQQRGEHPPTFFEHGIMQLILDYTGDAAFMVPEGPSPQPIASRTSNIVRDLLVTCNGDIHRLSQKQRDALWFIGRYIRHLDLSEIDLRSDFLVCNWTFCKKRLGIQILSKTDHIVSQFLYRKGTRWRSNIQALTVGTDVFSGWAVPARLGAIKDAGWLSNLRSFRVIDSKAALKVSQLMNIVDRFARSRFLEELTSAEMPFLFLTAFSYSSVIHCSSFPLTNCIVSGKFSSSLFGNAITRPPPQLERLAIRDPSIFPPNFATVEQSVGSLKHFEYPKLTLDQLALCTKLESLKTGLGGSDRAPFDLSFVDEFLLSSQPSRIPETLVEAKLQYSTDFSFSFQRSRGKGPFSFLHFDLRGIEIITALRQKPERFAEVTHLDIRNVYNISLQNDIDQFMAIAPKLQVVRFHRCSFLNASEAEIQAAVAKFKRANIRYVIAPTCSNFDQMPLQLRV